MAIARFPESLKQIGPFADRAGSDALRGRIVAQEEIQIAASPWLGNGPGTSRVEVLGQSFFFHNSYVALQNEGGRIAQALLLLAGLAALVGLVRLDSRLRNHWYEAALIAVAVCAINLGEVLLELPTALALGMAAFHARTVTAGAADIGPPSRPDRPLTTIHLAANRGDIGGGEVMLLRLADGARPARLRRHGRRPVDAGRPGRPGAGPRPGTGADRL